MWAGGIKEVAGSSGRMYIRSLLPIYRQIGRMCELEFGYVMLDEIVPGVLGYNKSHQEIFHVP